MLSLLLLALGQRTFDAPVLVANVNDTRITESSGLAPSLAVPGTWLTMNDSGNPPAVFRFDNGGNVTAEYKLKGATNVDWEDMAIHPGRGMVYVGDIGDNFRVRANIKVYRFREPTQTGIRDISDYETFTFRYPSGAQNAETLLVDPKSGDIWIVTKIDSGVCQVYSATPSASSTVTLRLVGTLTIDTGGGSGGKLATGGAFSLDGRYVIVRTYTGAREYAVPSSRNWHQSSPLAVPMPSSGGGEAVSYASDGHMIFTTTEGRPFPFHKIVVH